MSVITAKGSEARENAEKENLDLSKIRLSLKDGDSHRVRILSADDYVEYNAVGDYNNGIYSQPVAANSPLIKAHKEGGAKFKDLFTRKRYAIAFGSLESGDLVFFDASRNQAKALIATIEEYKEDLDDYAFTISRTGKGTSTAYSLNPVLKMAAEEKKVFDKLADTEVTMDFFENVLQPNDDDFVIKLLTEIDPSVIKLFPEADLSAFEDDFTEVSEETTVVGDDDLPF